MSEIFSETIGIKSLRRNKRDINLFMVEIAFQLVLSPQTVNFEINFSPLKAISSCVNVYLLPRIRGKLTINNTLRRKSQSILAHSSSCEKEVRLSVASDSEGSGRRPKGSAQEQSPHKCALQAAITCNASSVLYCLMYFWALVHILSSWAFAAQSTSQRP
ncbi:hypothetical protein RF11_05914 [Thelohanellus kitauei]|uniref:Uncharacterized protein n=1 Tax=Thelohanellus kitauei TaxID=669202 RepID=A0A0C2N0A9_THEKT|nr:hypothetical protein RF11_05914 [Thelohanellus kitauei]